MIYTLATVVLCLKKKGHLECGFLFLWTSYMAYAIFYFPFFNAPVAQLDRATDF